jgi:hypothetical protein
VQRQSTIVPSAEETLAQALQSVLRAGFETSAGLIHAFPVCSPVFTFVTRVDRLDSVQVMKVFPEAIDRTATMDDPEAD